MHTQPLIERVAVITYGCSGAGKKSAGVTIDRIYGSKTLETGEFCRLQFAQQAANGELVKDSAIISAISDQIISQGLPSVFSLDGAPRTAEQAELLIQLFHSLEYRKLISFFIDTPNKVCYDRIRTRALEEDRPDDANVQTILRRIRNFRGQATTIVPFLMKYTRFHRIDGTNPKASRTQEIERILTNELGSMYLPSEVEEMAA